MQARQKKSTSTPLSRHVEITAGMKGLQFSSFLTKASNTFTCDGLKKHAVGVS